MVTVEILDISETREFLFGNFVQNNRERVKCWAWNFRGISVFFFCSLRGVFCT